MRKAVWVAREALGDRRAIDDLMADAALRGIRDVLARLPEGDLASHLVRAGASVGVRVHAWLESEDPAVVLGRLRVDGLHCDTAEASIRAARASDRLGTGNVGLVVSTSALPTPELVAAVDLFTPRVFFSDVDEVRRTLRSVRGAAPGVETWAGVRAGGPLPVGAVVRVAAESGCEGVVLSSYDATRKDTLDEFAAA